MHYLHLTLLQAVSSIFCSPTSSHVSDLQLFSSVVICSTRFSPWKNRMYVSIGYMLSVYHFQPNISLCPIPLQHYLLLWSLSSSFFSAHTLSFSVPFPFHFSFYSVSYFFSSQWQESPFSLCLVYPTAGCLAGRDVDSMAGQASSLDVGASSQWLWSAWTGISRFAISDMVRN